MKQFYTAAYCSAFNWASFGLGCLPEENIWGVRIQKNERLRNIRGQVTVILFKKTDDRNRALIMPIIQCHYLDSGWCNRQVFVTIVVSDGFLSYDYSSPKWLWHWKTSTQTKCSQRKLLFLRISFLMPPTALIVSLHLPLTAYPLGVKRLRKVTAQFVPSLWAHSFAWVYTFGELGKKIPLPIFDALLLCPKNFCTTF